MELNPEDQKALCIVAQIDELFAIDAQGREKGLSRNWIHIGSEEAVPRVAAIISIVETCRRLKMPIRDYLCSILPGLANFPINRSAELMPPAWLARN